MRIETCPAAVGAALLAAASVFGGEPSRVPDSPAVQAESAPSRGYDEIYGEILQNLSGQSRAKVDSARTKAESPAKVPEEAAAAKRTEPERGGKREKALEKLAPEVKARVEKAIRDMETKRRERELEFRELEK